MKREMELLIELVGVVAPPGWLDGTSLDAWEMVDPDGSIYHQKVTNNDHWIGPEPVMKDGYQIFAHENQGNFRVGIVENDSSNDPMVWIDDGYAGEVEWRPLEMTFSQYLLAYAFDMKYVLPCTLSGFAVTDEQREKFGDSQVLVKGDPSGEDPDCVRNILNNGYVSISLSWLTLIPFEDEDLEGLRSEVDQILR